MNLTQHGHGYGGGNLKTPSMNDIPPAPSKKRNWPWAGQDSGSPDEVTDGIVWPRISVVTPSYNQGKFVEETIRSVLLQGYPNLEFIIMDGGSTDKTLDIIRKYEPWVTEWISERDRGQADAINKGWRKCTGDILTWLNSDDAYLPHTLFRVALAWCRSDRPGMIYGDALSTDIHLEPYYKKSMGSYSLKDLLRGKNMPQPAVFISKELFDRLGLLDESLFYTMDPEYFFRAWLDTESSSFRYVPHTLAYSRRYDDTKCQSGGLERVEENVMVLNRIWFDRMRPYQASLAWRHAYAVGLTLIGQRYGDLGDIKEMVRYYKKASQWSPFILPKAAKNMFNLFIRKQRKTFPY